MTTKLSPIDLKPDPSFPERRVEEDPFYDLVYQGRPAAPMVKLGFHVMIRGGLALIKTTRTYVNTESGPIEAIMSLPVPVRAAFYGLTAMIDGKRYNGQAKSKLEAREIYEDALDEGRAAVLHEELLRGIHSLSVGNLGAGKKVTVVTRWVELLRFQEGAGQLRIPLTVGDVYGVSPLAEAVDELKTGGSVPQATLHVEHDGSSIEVIDGHLKREGKGYFAHVPGNAPIHLRVTGLAPTELTGFCEEQQVHLKISPEEKSCEPLDVVVLVDRSGSMSCPVAYGSAESQHEAVVRGLRKVQPFLSDEDQLALWEFDTECDRVSKSSTPNQFIERLSRLGEPRGGTEVGGALEKVCKSEEGKDILLITDGQSYHLDVDRLSKIGSRFFVVLVGEGSLEAMVGHLAVLSGGDLQFSFGADVGQAIVACIQGMRQKRMGNAHWDFDEEGAPMRLITAENNAVLEASWSKKMGETVNQDDFSDAVAAFASSLAFAGAEEECAAGIAEKAGLVTHLTSLVLVAEDGVIQKELPTTIKQSLPDSRTRTHANINRHRTLKYHLAPSTSAQSSAGVTGRHSPLRHAPLNGPQLVAFCNRPPVLEIWHGVERLGERIDWYSTGTQLAQGNLVNLPSDIAETVMGLAGNLEDLADELGMSHEVFVIALAAYAVRKLSKQAAHVYRRLLKDCDRQEFKEYALRLRART